jgi:MYXO-CTERM domain-containing protein
MEMTDSAGAGGNSLALGVVAVVALAGGRRD